jgi:hypothetical protein
MRRCVVTPTTAGQSRFTDGVQVLRAAAGLSTTCLFVTGSVTDVDVEFEDGSHAAFTYDLETKELTPASIAFADRVGVSERRAAVNYRRRAGRMSA